MKIIENYTNIGGNEQIPNLLVIHAMAEKIKLDNDLKIENKTIKAGVYESHDWLQILGLSAHFLEYPDGSFIKQRSTTKICWHAKGFNVNSIGIEVLAKGTHNYNEFLEIIKTDWATPEQYKNLIAMSQNLIDYFDIKKVVRHSDLSPGRKYDPGSGFKWDWFISQLIIN